jgi:hypothetical protein
MEALAHGAVSKLAKRSCGLAPSSDSINALIIDGGTGGAASCSLDNSCR